jgi:tRNA nucleotidyltransferase (CCA-adding enzyme)
VSRRIVNASDLGRALEGGLTGAVNAAIAAIVAAASPVDVFIVGGAVRDLLLARAISDIDLVTEGDAPAIGCAALPPARWIVHERFGTASVVVDGTRIDLATARRETYAAAGALPDVEPASIAEDLRRRDFSINAIGLRLGREPEILDPSCGRDDLEARVMRALHDDSFRDDATRIFRAFRYAARLGFDIEPHTGGLIRRGLPFIDAIGGERLRRELEFMLLEPQAGLALECAAAAGALQTIHPALSWDSRRAQGLSDAPPGVPHVTLGFALLAAGASQDETLEIAARLKLTRAESDSVVAVGGMRKLAPLLSRDGAKPSGVAMLLDRFPPPAVAAFAATTDDPIAASLALRYLGEWRITKPILNGDDVIAMGVPVGPQVQRVLQLIRAARLDGWASDRGDETALVLRFAKSIHDSSAAQADAEVGLNGT